MTNLLTLIGVVLLAVMAMFYVAESIIEDDDLDIDLGEEDEYDF